MTVGIRYPTGMKISAAALAIGLLTTGLAPTADAGEPSVAGLPGIIGTDGRIRIDSAAPPWNAIGRVNRRFGGFCSGALVGADRVLTAAHCLFNARTGRWPPARSLHFVAGYRRNEYVADAVVARTTIAGHENLGDDATGSVRTGIEIDRRGRPKHVAQDWAYLTLSKPMAGFSGPPAAGGTVGGAGRDGNPSLPPIRPFPFYRGSLAALEGKSIVLAAYHQDASHILSVEADCHLSGIVEGGRVFTHTCDSTKGASGAPIFVMRDGALQIVGITVGILKREGKAVGVGVRPPF